MGLKVDGCRAQLSRIILHHAYGHIAAIAKKRTNFSRCVIVVDWKRPAAAGFSRLADGTLPLLRF